MILKILLTGDVNLMNVTDPAGPFAQVAAEFKSADLVFSNLECCFYEPDAAHALDREGFFAPLASAEALKIAGIDAVGIANNVNYGTAPILSSIARLDQLGIPHTGAGATLQKAREPAVLEWQGRRIGMLQRTSVFWTTDHEAADNAVGVATIRGHTAYQVPMFRAGPGAIPLNRPGVPPAIVTWADPPSLQRFRDDVAALKARCNIVIASVTGVWIRPSSSTCGKSPILRSTPALMASSATGRISRCRSKAIPGSRSITVSAASPFIPGTAASNTAIGSACSRN